MVVGLIALALFFLVATALPIRLISLRIRHFSAAPFVACRLRPVRGLTLRALFPDRQHQLLHLTQAGPTKGNHGRSTGWEQTGLLHARSCGRTHSFWYVAALHGIQNQVAARPVLPKRPKVKLRASPQHGATTKGLGPTFGPAGPAADAVGLAVLWPQPYLQRAGCPRLPLCPSASLYLLLQRSRPVLCHDWADLRSRTEVRSAEICAVPG